MLYLKETCSWDHYSYSDITTIWFSGHFPSNCLHNAGFRNIMTSLHHHPYCWCIEGQLCLPMLVQIIRRFQIKWRQGMLSLRVGSLDHAGDGSRAVQDTKRVSPVTKWDFWSHSFCHPSIHSLPRFSANPTMPSWLEVGRTHFLLTTHHWSFCLCKTLLNLLGDIKCKVQLRINILNVEINLTFFSESPDFWVE